MSKKEQKTDSSIGSLSRLGFNSLSDCLLAVPKEYRDFTNPITDITKANKEIKLAYSLTYVSSKMFDKEKVVTRKMRDCFRLSLTFKDENNAPVQFSVFGGAFAWKDYIYSNEEKKALLWAKLDEFNGLPCLKEVELISSNLLGKVFPVYAGKVGRVSASKVHEGVIKAMNLVEEASMSLVSKIGIRDSQFTNYAGMPASEFIRKLHWPSTIQEAEYVREKASDIAMLGIVQSAVDYRVKTPSEKASIKIPDSSIDSLVVRMPFSMTADQIKTINDIVKGLRDPFPSLDLISADVGIGKSVTFMIPAAAASMTGAHVGIMAPTMLLAEQLYKEMKGYFPELDIGMVKPSGKIENLISIGTTALIGAAKRSKINFNLVVIDEQHKFGAEQRAALIQAHTNLIESTATPIPRSIALVTFGGYRLLHMTECPVKKSIHTRVVSKEDGRKAFEFVKKVISEKGQVAIVYPAVESTGESDAKTVKDAAIRWEKAFPGRVATIHGKLSEDEKINIIQGMKDHKYDLLCASSLIEVGITLPSLKLMGVQDSDYFGLAQLHQLRGRVARKGGRGYCLLFPSSGADEDATSRLKILEECTDGYELAERDMENRGFGNLDYDADSQHGKTSTILWNAKLDPKKIEHIATNLTQILASIQ